MEKSNELSVVLNRHCSNIQSEDRKKRKEALQELHKEIFVKNNFEDSNVLFSIFEDIQKNVWKSLYDQSEVVRDSCISLLSEFASRLKLKENFLEEFIPVLLWRLGEKEINEPSEEIRLRLVTLLNLVITNCKENVAAFTGDIVQILSQTIVDSYPKIRQESCTCASNLARTVPRHFYEHSNRLIKPILVSFNHQHFRMRIAAIEALGTVVRWGSTKNLPIQEVFGSLAERLFDSIINVRKTVIQVIGDWLVNLHDRYSFFTKMVPLILTGLCDELPELRLFAWELWSKAGEQYEEENEQELKEKMDFLSEKPEHYPPNVIRPNLGCRTLVQRNTCQITAALSKELEDWKVDIRIKSAQLLCWLVLHAETDITQHTENLLLTMYKVCNQKDDKIIDNVTKAAEYIAYFVPPDVYMKLVIPVIQDSCTPGHLCVLAALIRGTQPDLFTPHIATIGEMLSDDNFCRVRKMDHQLMLLQCCNALLSIGQANCKTIERELVTILVTTKALTSSLSEPVEQLLEKLLKVTDKNTVVDLYRDHIGFFLKKMDSTVETWTSVSCDYFILQFILAECSTCLGSHLSHINALLKSAMKPERDSTVRSKLFIDLSYVLCRRHVFMDSITETEFGTFILSLVLDIICPNLVWHCGRTAEALRSVAVACLTAGILPPKEAVHLFDDVPIELPSNPDDKSSLEFLTKDYFEEIFKVLFPLLLNSLEDCAYKTRYFSLKSLERLIIVAANREILNPDHVNQCYPLMLKRLDDVNNNVRMLVAHCLRVLYERLPVAYNATTYRLHLESFFDVLLIHLDDPDENFQKPMTDLLKTVGKVDPKFLHEKLETVKERFRNYKMCNDILSYLKSEYENSENKN